MSFFAPAVGVTQTKEAIMSSAAHTPGPWWGMNHYSNHVNYFSPTREDDYTFRVVFPDDMPEAEAEANTRLIAAAPELLEAAETVLSRWGKGDLAEVVRELNAAIATAKGRSP